MKTLHALAISIAVLLASCNNAEVTNKVEATDPAAKADSTQATTPATTGDAYAVLKDSSVITWKGSNKFTPKAHVGTVLVSEGTFNVANNQVTGGKFTVDLNSITTPGDQYTDGEKKAGKLVGHLKSEDFFDVAKYPNSVFEVTAVEPVTGKAGVTHNVTGNLTIKGITKQITFPANVTVAGNRLTANATFTIDRSQWEVKYGSETFFSNLGDGVINNNIELTLNVVAVKPAA